MHKQTKSLRLVVFSNDAKCFHMKSSSDLLNDENDLITNNAKCPYLAIRSI